VHRAAPFQLISGLPGSETLRRPALRILAAALLAFVPPAFAQSEPSVLQTAKNPLANVVNVQFIYDANLGVGANDKTQHVLTFQPVIPFSITPDWSLITRTIAPVIAQPPGGPGESWVSGPGDIQISAFLSPARGDKFVWGVGPVLEIPSATNDALGQGKWAAGPTAAALWFGEQWSVGGLINNVWSFAGDGARPAVNRMQIQPQINYNFKSNPDRYLSFSPVISANWKERGGERWVVPVSLGLGQLVKIGKQSVNFQATAYYNVVKPTDAGNWTLEFLVQFLFPK
jgi:hypothetical protein